MVWPKQTTLRVRIRLTASYCVKQENWMVFHNCKAQNQTVGFKRKRRDKARQYALHKVSIFLYQES